MICLQAGHIFVLREHLTKETKARKATQIEGKTHTTEQDETAFIYTAMSQMEAMSRLYAYRTKFLNLNFDRSFVSSRAWHVHNVHELYCQTKKKSDCFLLLTSVEVGV